MRISRLEASFGLPTYGRYWPKAIFCNENSYFFRMFSLLLKEYIFKFSYVVTAAGIVPCGGP